MTPIQETQKRSVRSSRVVVLMVLASPGILLSARANYQADFLLGILFAVVIPLLAIAYKRRKRIRITLRTALLFLTIACVGFGYLTNKANTERAAVEAIRKAGGRVVRDPKPLFKERADSNSRERSVTEQIFRPLLGSELFYNVSIVTLYGAGCNDENLKHVLEFPTVRHLRLLPWEEAPDYGPMSLAPRPNQVSANRAGITDDGLLLVRRLRNLRHIAMTGNRVSEAGLWKLVELPHLKSIQVDTDNGSQVTEETYMQINDMLRSRAERESD